MCHVFLYFVVMFDCLYFQALIDEDRLLSRLEVLENQLHAYSKVSITMIMIMIIIIMIIIMIMIIMIMIMMINIIHIVIIMIIIIIIIIIMIIIIIIIIIIILRTLFNEDGYLTIVNLP